MAHAFLAIARQAFCLQACAQQHSCFGLAGPWRMKASSPSGDSTRSELVRGNPTAARNPGCLMATNGLPDVLQTLVWTRRRIAPREAPS
eukprot:12396530-Prorocentrum_lima.AAC.1